MYNVSDEFKNAIQSTSRLMSCKAYLNGVELSVDKILKLDIEDNINNGDYFTIGEVPSKLLTIEMLGVDVIEGAEIKPYYGVEVSPGKFEYIPCGVFYVDSFTTNKNKVTATCYDKMLRLDDEYIPNIAIPVTLSEITNDICQQKEIEFEGQLPSITINKSIKGYSYREMIGFIASFCGGNAKFNRFGKLIIQQYVKSSKIVNADVCGKFEHKDIYTVSAIACKFGDIANTRGDSSANCVNFTNPFVDDTNIDSIFNRLNGLSFMASSFKYNGDPSIDSGELITVNDIKGNSHTVLVSTQSFTFSGGLSSEVTSIGEGKGANAYKQYKFKNKKSITELNIELGLLQGIISEVEEKQEDTYSKTETETLVEAKAGEISLEVAKKEISNMQFGVENLLLGTSDYTPSTIWHNSDSNWHDDTFKGCKVYYVSHDWAGMKYYIKDLINRYILQAGVTYTISCYAIASAPGVYGGFYSDGFGFVQVGELSTSWTQYSFTFTPTQEQINSITDTGKIRFEPHNLSGTGHRVYAACYKLEKGSKATDYVKSCEDLPTISEMNSAIIQKANEITSTVEVTKTSGIELLPQGYLRNSSSGYSSSYNTHHVNEWGLYTTGREWVGTDFIAIDPLLPLSYYFYVQNTGGRNPLTYVGIEQHDWRKQPIGANATTIYFIHEKFTGYKSVSGVLDSDALDGKTKFIRFRFLTNWDNSGIAESYIHEMSLKQLRNMNSSTQIAQMEDRITSTVNTLNTVDGKVVSAQSQIDQQANEIASKVDVNGVKSIIRQSPEDFRIGFNGMTDNIVMHPWGMRTNAPDGSFSEFHGGQMTHYIAGANYKYHSLTHVETIVSQSQWCVIDGTYYVPERFRNKNFNVIATVSHVAFDRHVDDAYKNLNISVTEINPANCSYRLHCTPIGVNIGGRYTVNASKLEVVVTVIA